MKGQQIVEKDCLFFEDVSVLGHPEVEGGLNWHCRDVRPSGCQTNAFDALGKLETRALSCEDGTSLPQLRTDALSVDDRELFETVGSVFGNLKPDVSINVKDCGNRGGQAASHSNLFSVLEDVDMDACTRSAGLKKKALTLVRWYRQLGLPFVRDLPEKVECGGLRAAVRQCFSHVSEAWELSFKSIQKVEKNCCQECEPRFSALLDQWLFQRFQPVDVDDVHLQKFRHAFRGNVDRGWDCRRRPFIPNGNATQSFKRREAGNWNKEPFSEDCRVALVFSSGKPRVVTLYSSRNTELLAPLHYSLYETLERKGWLLKGEPTPRHIERLTGTRYLSFDYQSATDMIKTAYVDAAVEILIDQADNLTEDEIRALRVLSRLRVEGDERVALRGQPMGSVMSFPLLCLINKTIVDMALTDLLVRKEISFREWSSHPCLINGDDLLTREVRHETKLREAITIHGGQVGMVVNQSKTMEHSQKAEINSTLFDSGRPVKKLNVSALWMKPEVDDVLGLAAEATLDVRSFVRVARANAHILSKQQDKKILLLPRSLQRAVRRDKKLRRACTALPEACKPSTQGVIRMSERPPNYTLSREEEYNAMVKEVDRVRDIAIQRYSVRGPSFRTRILKDAQSFSRARRLRQTSERELIPKCYADCFNLKQWEGVMSEVLAEQDFIEQPFDGSTINHMIDLLKVFRMNHPDSRSHPGTIDASADFVSVVC